LVDQRPQVQKTDLSCRGFVGALLRCRSLVERRPGSSEHCQKWLCHRMSSFSLGGLEPQEAGGVVVEDVAFLLGRQVIGVLNDADGIGH
jgi:hypothetical protein